MLTSSSRLLRLLSLLQTRRHWAGAELAATLAVHPRTLRRDIDKLREYKGNVIKKLTGGLAGMAKARKVTTVRGVCQFLDANHIEGT